MNAKKCIRLEHRSATPGWAGAFTLIEMLVVIAIIGILAALIISAMPALQERKIRNHVKTKLAELETAIEMYKDKKGFYPPDNVKNPALPPLFYELGGTVQSLDQSGQTNYMSLYARTNFLGQADVKSFFGLDGFLNSGPVLSGDPDFKNTVVQEQILTVIRNINPSSIQDLPQTVPAIKVFAIPYRGPTGEPNTWRYVSSSATNNPGSFDLWAEVIIRGNNIVIGNWKD